MDSHTIRRIVEEELPGLVREHMAKQKKAPAEPEFDIKQATEDDCEYAVKYMREDASLGYERALQRSMRDSYILRGRTHHVEEREEHDDRMTVAELDKVVEYMRDSGETDADVCLQYVRTGRRPAKPAQPGKPRRTEAPATVHGRMTEAELEPVLQFMREGKSQEEALRMVRSGR